MKSFKQIIKTTIRQYLNEQQMSNKTWYHGTPDSREVEDIGGFTHKSISVRYVSDYERFKDLQTNMENARQIGDMDLYFNLLNKNIDYMGVFTYKKPLFLSDKYSVAKTYADSKRAFDYQNAVEKVYLVGVTCSKIVEIVAHGDKFRLIPVDKVKQGFIKSGVSEDEIDKLILRFNYYVMDNKGVKTDVIAAIGNWLGFDCIDVVGVLDSYHGGGVKSTVRMVLDPTNAGILSAKG
jgi:hypothetical protein